MRQIVPSPRNGRIPLGVWIHSLQSAGNRDEMRRVVERMVTQGFDILFACVKQVDGCTDYPSRLATQSDWACGRDPLQELTAAAREFGLKVHAWYCVFPEGKNSRLLQQHPEFAAIQNHPAKGLQSDKPEMWGESLRWSCINRPEVREYHYNLMSETIDRYDVDGIHLDWIRSGFHQCFCAHCREKCRELTGADLVKEMGNFHPQAKLWYDFRANNVTELVCRVADRTHAKEKETSAAVFCTFPLSYNEQAQEWPRWLREGALDLAIPMTYSTIPAETHYYSVNHVALHRDAGRGELWEGICTHGIDGDLLTTISRSAIETGAVGLVLFSYPDLTESKLTAVRAGLAAVAR